MVDNIICIKQLTKQTGILCFKNIICKVWLGENGITEDKVEGDLKTPLGKFDLGIVFGFHNRDEIKINNKIDYIKITDSMYWDCDVNSKTYNKLVGVIKKDGKILKANNFNLNISEHLINYPIEYEFAIEVKTNPMQVQNKGSAIFIHCYNNKPTKGCVAIKREKMIELLGVIDKKTRVLITK